MKPAQRPAKFIIHHSSLIIFLLFPLLVFSQKFTLRGTVADSLGGPLESATVMLMNPADSALLSFGRSREAGQFELKNVSAGRFLLRCTYLGYVPFQKMVEVGGAEKVVDLGKIALKTNAQLLGEATISADASPVRINKDTLEFRAASFKTQPNATVEDLLKKLPGVEVNKNGDIRAQGEPVKNVLVEGKKFFGDDPKMATQNLPADAVEKVQIFDKKSETATFTGVDDGQKEKTINLDLKEEAKAGWFGKLNAAAGGGEKIAPRFEGKASLNKFGPKSQISFLGIGNNTNLPGFSVDDYMQYTGAMRQMMSGGEGRFSLQFDLEDPPIPLDFGGNEGFLRTGAAGVNVNREFGPVGKTSNLNGSYFYSNLLDERHRESFRSSFSPEGNFTTGQLSNQSNTRESHRGQFSFDQKIDSANAFTVNFSAIRTNTKSNFAGSGIAYGTFGLPVNFSNQTYASDSRNTSLAADLNFRHKFKKRGRNVALNANFGKNTGDADGQNFSASVFLQTARRDTLNQISNGKSDAQTFGAGLTFTEPLGKKRYLEFSYNFNRADNQADKTVFDKLADGTTLINPAFSNAYESRFDYHRPGLGYRINRKTWNASGGADFQLASLVGEVSTSAGVPISRRFNHLLPRLRFEKEFTANSRLQFNYRSNVNAPRIQQLQPVPDVRDPLNIQLGNPDLRPEYRHEMEAHFTKFNPNNNRSFFGGLFFTATQDQIVQAQTIDSQLVRTLRPENSPAGYQSWLNLSFGLPVKKWNSRLSLRGELSFSETQSRLNGAENRTRTTGIKPSFDWEYTLPGDKFTATSGAEMHWESARYALDPTFNRDYLTQTYFSDLTWNMPAAMTLTSSFNVVVNGGRAAGFDQTISIWNASLGKYFGKRKQLELAVVARDLLGQNQGLHLTNNLNYSENERITSLSQYFMLRATYALNSLGGGQSGGPQMRVLIRR